jgi:hypothetical protein
MGLLLGISDFIVLFLIVIYIPRDVWKHEQGSGSLALSIVIALALIVFALVSFASYLSLVEVSSSLTRGILLVILLGMAALLRLSWVSKPVA